jgi:hypothetical protein
VAAAHCAVFELRQYTLHPGRRDELIELFDAHLVESQEEVGMHVLGQFRDVDRADRFVWFRGYPDMATRRDGLTRFYLGGAAWARHRGAANATMIDSDDVLLLRPVPGAADLCAAVGPRPVAGQPEPAGVYTATIHHLGAPADGGVRHWLAETRPVLEARGARILGVLRTEPAANNFPQLPIRETVDVLVVIARHGSHDERRSFAAHPAVAEAGRRFARFEDAPREDLVLEPAPRSALR